VCWRRDVFSDAWDRVRRRPGDVVDTDRERYMCWFLEFTDAVYCEFGDPSWCGDIDLAFRNHNGYDTDLHVECGCHCHGLLPLGQ